MASVLRFQDLSPSLTPPPSDKGECEDIAMISSETYLPQGFYPSPAPSFSDQRPAFAPQSPDMGHSDSTYDTEEDPQQNFYFGNPDSQVFNTTSLQNPAICSTAMPYQSFEQSAWAPYGSYPSTVSMYPYAADEPSSVYTGYTSQAPNSIVPPVPQTVTGASFSFNEPICKPQDSTNFLRSYSNASVRHESPAAPSTTSVSGFSSRSGSPNPHDAHRSSVPQRSSSSSLHSYGIPIRSPDSTAVQAWRCAYPHCTSRAVFTRGCDLRKHYNRHSKHLFCRVDGCPQSEAACVAVAQQQAIQAGLDASDPSKLAVSGGFSSKKDRARHEAKHSPSIACEFDGCGRIFSRVDNMKDHMRRIHQKGQTQSQQQSTTKRKATQ